MIISITGINAADESFSEESEDMKMNLQRMQWRVVELERVCKEMKNNMSRLVRLPVRISLSSLLRPGGHSVLSLMLDSSELQLEIVFLEPSRVHWMVGLIFLTVTRGLLAFQKKANNLMLRFIASISMVAMWLHT